jgi:hypothetical protein
LIWNGEGSRGGEGTNSSVSLVSDKQCSFYRCSHKPTRFLFNGLQFTSLFQICALCSKACRPSPRGILTSLQLMGGRGEPLLALQFAVNHFAGACSLPSSSPLQVLLVVTLGDNIKPGSVDNLTNHRISHVSTSLCPTGTSGSCPLNCSMKNPL